MAKNLRDATARKDDATDKRERAGGNLRATIPYHDLREWLAEAEKLGEVVTLTGKQVTGRAGPGSPATLPR